MNFKELATLSTYNADKKLSDGVLPSDSIGISISAVEEPKNLILRKLKCWKIQSALISHWNVGWS